jgi:hypothetical protein
MQVCDVKSKGYTCKSGIPDFIIYTISFEGIIICFYLDNMNQYEARVNICVFCAYWRNMFTIGYYNLYIVQCVIWIMHVSCKLEVVCQKAVHPFLCALRIQICLPIYPSNNNIFTYVFDMDWPWTYSVVTSTRPPLARGFLCSPLTPHIPYYTRITDTQAHKFSSLTNLYTQYTSTCEHRRNNTICVIRGIFINIISQVADCYYQWRTQGRFI